MMRAFSTEELARMQGTQESAMQDTCEILGYAQAGRDSHNMPLSDYPVAATTTCGFDPTASKEVLDGTQVAVTDAQLRLPLSLDGSIDNRDRIRLTKRFGVDLGTAVTYEIIGDPERGPSGLVLNLRLATDGS